MGARNEEKDWRKKEAILHVISVLGFMMGEARVLLCTKAVL